MMSFRYTKDIICRNINVFEYSQPRKETGHVFWDVYKAISFNRNFYSDFHNYSSAERLNIYYSLHKQNHNPFKLELQRLILVVYLAIECFSYAPCGQRNGLYFKAFVRNYRDDGLKLRLEDTGVSLDAYVEGPERKITKFMAAAAEEVTRIFLGGFVFPQGWEGGHHGKREKYNRENTDLYEYSNRFSSN